MNLPQIETQLNYTLPTYDFKNKSELTEKMATIADQLNKTIVSPDNVKDVSDLIKETNKRIKLVNNKRIEISNSFRKPANALKTDTDEVLEVVVEAVANLKAKVNDIESQEKDEKKQMLYNTIINPACESRDVNPDDVVFDKKWLNKSTSRKTIVSAVTAIADSLAKANERRRVHLINGKPIDTGTGQIVDAPIRMTTITYFSDDENLRQHINDLIKNANVINIENKGE